MRNALEFIHLLDHLLALLLIAGVVTLLDEGLIEEGLVNIEDSKGELNALHLVDYAGGVHDTNQ